MRRAALVLAVGCVALTGRALAAAPPAFQPDVTIAEHGDPVSAGDDIYNGDAAGQTRSIIVTKRVVLDVGVENDGTGDCSYRMTASPPAPGFDVRYFVRLPGRAKKSRGTNGRLDATPAVLNGAFAFENVHPGERRTLVVVVTTRSDTPLGAEQPVLVTATSTTDPDQLDAAKATVTKVSEAVGP